MGGMEGWLAHVPAWATLLASALGPAGLIGGWWAHKRASRKQTDDQSLKLVEELREIMTLERRTCDAKIEALEARLSCERHARGNLAMCVEMLLVGYDLPPEKREAHIRRVKDRLGRIDDLPEPELADAA